MQPGLCARLGAWKTDSVCYAYGLVPHREDDPGLRLVADHTHKEPCNKDRMGGELLLFT